MPRPVISWTGVGPLKSITGVNIHTFLKKQTASSWWFFLGLPLNQISAEEVAETVASSNVHHKQDYLSELILNWEYILTPSLC